MTDHTLDKLLAAKFEGVSAEIALIIINRLKVESLTIKGVADNAGMSVRSLQRALLFEGHSFSDIRHSVRMRIAVELLTRTDLPMSEIGLRIGFPHCASFCIFFKRISGVTPLSYREMNHPC